MCIGRNFGAGLLVLPDVRGYSTTRYTHDTQSALGPRSLCSQSLWARTYNGSAPSPCGTRIGMGASSKEPRLSSRGPFCAPRDKQDSSA
tara:strand:+ start:17701 stop:17967 length:267 start_codon:yes stop_codon:yes gene_type:complete